MRIKICGLALSLLVLGACDPSYQSRPDPTPEPKKSGISISGYGRVGVSTRN